MMTDRVNAKVRSDPSSSTGHVSDNPMRFRNHLRISERVVSQGCGWNEYDSYDGSTSGSILIYTKQ